MYSSLDNDQLFDDERPMKYSRHHDDEDAWYGTIPSVEPSEEREDYEPIGLKQNEFSVNTWDHEPQFSPPKWEAKPGAEPKRKILRQDGLVGVAGTDDLAYGPDWIELEQALRERQEADGTYLFYDEVGGNTGVEIEEVAHLDDFETRLSRLQQQQEHLKRQTRWETQALQKQTQDYARLSKELAEKRDQLAAFGYRGSAGRIAQHHQNVLGAAITAYSTSKQSAVLLSNLLTLTPVVRRTMNDWKPIPSGSEAAKDAVRSRNTARDVLDFLKSGTAETTRSGATAPTFQKTITVSWKKEEGEDVPDEIKVVVDQKTIDRVHEAVASEFTKERKRELESNITGMDVWPIVALAELAGISVLLRVFPEDFPKGSAEQQLDIEGHFERLLDTYDEPVRSKRTNAIVAVSNEVSKLPWEDIQTLWLGAYRERLDARATKTLKELRIDAGSARANLTDIIARMPRKGAPKDPRVPAVAPDATPDALVNHAEQLIERFESIIQNQRNDPKSVVEQQIDDIRRKMEAVENFIGIGPKPPDPKDASTLPYRHRSEWATSPLLTGKLRIRSVYRTATRVAHNDLIKEAPDFRDVDYERFQFHRDRGKDGEWVDSLDDFHIDFALLVAHQFALTRARNPMSYKRDRESRIRLDKITSIRGLRDSYVWNSSEQHFVRL